MVNIKYLKENAESLDNDQSLSNIERAIVSFFLREDYDQLMSVLDGFSDAEAFELYKKIVNEESPVVEFNLANEEFNVENPKLDLLLMHRKIQHEISPEVKDFLQDSGKVLIQLTLTTKNESIYALPREKVSIKKHLNKALQEIPKKVTSVMNWKNSSNMMAVAVLGLSLAACSKAVYKEESSNLSPISGGNLITLPEEVNIIEKNLYFANHAEPLSHDELYTKNYVENNSIYQFPLIVDNFSFKNRSGSPSSLHLFINNEYFCSYVLSENNYELHPTCEKEVVLIAGSFLEIRGIPAGETISFKVKIK